MYRVQCVLPLVALYVGFAQSWDFAVSRGKQIEFYTNDVKTDTVSFNSHNPAALAYDEVNNVIFYVDKQLNNDSICGHDISSKENTCFIERNGRNIRAISYDPATSVIYFTDINDRSINYISLLKGRGNKYGDLLIKKDHGIPTDIVVESCRGYIYWINTNLDTPTIERARLDGLERQVVINSKSLSVNTTYNMEPHSLSIDLQTQKIYWIEPNTVEHYSLYYADLNGNSKTFLNYIQASNLAFLQPSANTLAVSKTSLFFTEWRYESKIKVFKLGKLDWSGPNSLKLETKNVINGVVANYDIKEQIQNINDCSALTYIHINERKNYCNGKFCVHGTKILGQALCKCPAGYSGERCEVSVCENYCFQGSCSVNDDGLPKCSCRAGYSGERCEVDVCHGYCQNKGDCTLNNKSEPVCQCKGGHAGDRCDDLGCLNFCIKGSCSLKDDGLPQCRCDAGYTGERCEIKVCHGYCQNNGYCSLNDKSEPVCQCKGGYAGDRCERSGCLNYCIKGSCSFNDEGLPQCRCDAGYSGERCEVNECYGYCLNDGVCSLNEADEASCECVGNFEGPRCETGLTITITLPSTSSYSVETNRTLSTLLSKWQKAKALVAVIGDEP